MVSKPKVKDTQKGDLVETYWSQYSGIKLSIDKREYNQKTNKYEKVPRTNVLGTPLMRGNDFEYVSEEIEFELFYSTAGKKEGDVPWCFYHVFKETPKYIVDELEKLRSEGSIYNDEEHMKMVNSEVYVEQLKNKKLEGKLSSAESENKALKAKLKDLEGKK